MRKPCRRQCPIQADMLQQKALCSWHCNPECFSCAHCLELHAATWIAIAAGHVSTSAAVMHAASNWGWIRKTGREILQMSLTQQPDRGQALPTTVNAAQPLAHTWKMMAAKEVMTGTVMTALMRPTRTAAASLFFWADPVCCCSSGSCSDCTSCCTCRGRRLDGCMPPVGVCRSSLLQLHIWLNPQIRHGLAECTGQTSALSQIAWMPAANAAGAASTGKTA